MNKIRRKQISQIKKDIIDYVEDVRVRLDEVKFDEEFAYDSMPEGLQSSMRGMDSEDSINILSDAIDELEQVVDLLNEIP